MSTVKHLHTALEGATGRGAARAILAGSNLRLDLLPPISMIEAKNASPWVHHSSLQMIQRFRGAMCLSNGLVRPEAVDANGYHFLSCDALNYHLLLTEQNGKLAACMRVRFHPVGTTASGLRMFSAIRRLPPILHVSSALNELILQGRTMQHGVAELGGWVVAPGWRDTLASNILPLFALALVRVVQQSVMLEHADATGETPSILRSIGGRPLAYQGTPIPAAHDSHHGRLMEVMTGFSSEVKSDLDFLLEEAQEIVEEIL